MKSFQRFGLVILIGVGCLTSVDASDNWPDWRGPTEDGHSDATGLPLNWSETENIAWKIPIHDEGHSTPVVWGDQIWLTTATKDGKTLYAVCIDLNSGEIVHDIEVFHPENPQGINSNNTYATPSAVIEVGRVYVHYGAHGTACLDTNTGEVLWRRTDLNCEHMQGPASSPVLYKDLLILTLEGTNVQYIVAVNKNTGEEVWRYDRPQDIYEKIEQGVYRKSYQTPVIVDIDGQTQMISNGALMVTGHIPETGEVLWQVLYGQDSTISRIVHGDGLLFVNCGGAPNRTQLWAIREGGSGDVTDTHVVWKMTDDAPHQSSPVLVDDLLYLMSDRGELICKEPVSGEDVWTERLKNDFGASLLYADGRIYITSKKGMTTVIEPGRTFNKLAENELDGEIWASPAVAGNSLLLRSKTHLYRIRNE
ncbi:MAG: PQQ-binding-like beta-propeller repeat protein [Candidatus Omnitrophica bacterium]|nr:PQQ-binding-like beta-propeller repeat protein [Candidatus Omnitrophota bacterium]